MHLRLKIEPSMVNLIKKWFLKASKKWKENLLFMIFQVDMFIVQKWLSKKIIFEIYNLIDPMEFGAINF